LITETKLDALKNSSALPVILPAVLAYEQWNNCVKKAVFTETRPRQQLQESTTPTVLELTAVDGLLKTSDCAAFNSDINCELPVMSGSVTHSSTTDSYLTTASELKVECSAASRVLKLSASTMHASLDDRRLSSEKHVSSFQDTSFSSEMSSLSPSHVLAAPSDDCKSCTSPSSFVEHSSDSDCCIVNPSAVSNTTPMHNYNMRSTKHSTTYATSIPAAKEPSIPYRRCSSVNLALSGPATLSADIRNVGSRSFSELHIDSSNSGDYTSGIKSSVLPQKSHKKCFKKSGKHAAGESWAERDYLHATIDSVSAHVKSKNINGRRKKSASNPKKLSCGLSIRKTPIHCPSSCALRKYAVSSLPTKKVANYAIISAKRLRRKSQQLVKRRTRPSIGKLASDNCTDVNQPSSCHDTLGIQTYVPAASLVLGVNSGTADTCLNQTDGKQSYRCTHCMSTKIDSTAKWGLGSSYSSEMCVEPTLSSTAVYFRNQFIVQQSQVKKPRKNKPCIAHTRPSPTGKAFVSSTEVASPTAGSQQMPLSSACANSYCAEPPDNNLAVADTPDLSASSHSNNECATEFTDFVDRSTWRTRSFVDASGGALLTKSCTVKGTSHTLIDFLLKNKTNEDTKPVVETVAISDKLASSDQISAIPSSVESHFNKVLSGNTDLLIRMDKNGTVNVMAKRSKQKSQPVENLSLNSVQCLTNNASPLRCRSVTDLRKRCSMQPVIDQVKSRCRRRTCFQLESSSSAQITAHPRESSHTVPALKMHDVTEANNNGASELAMRNGVNRTIDGKAWQSKQSKVISKTEALNKTVGKEVGKMKSDSNVGRLALKRSAKTLGIVKFTSSQLFSEMQSKADKAGLKKLSKCRTAQDRNHNLRYALGTATALAALQQNSSINHASTAQMAHLKNNCANVQVSKSNSHCLPGIMDLVHRKNIGSTLQHASVSPFNGVGAEWELTDGYVEFGQACEIKISSHAHKQGVTKSSNCMANGVVLHIPDSADTSNKVCELFSLADNIEESQPAEHVSSAEQSEALSLNYASAASVTAVSNSCASSLLQTLPASCECRSTAGSATVKPMLSSPDIHLNCSCLVSVSEEGQHGNIRVNAGKNGMGIHKSHDCAEYGVSQNVNVCSVQSAQSLLCGPAISQPSVQAQTVPVQHVERNDFACPDILRMALAQSGIYSSDAPSLSLLNDVSTVIASSVHQPDNCAHSMYDADGIKSAQNPTVSNNCLLVDHHSSFVSCSKCSRQLLQNTSCLSQNKLQLGHDSDDVCRNCSSLLPGHCSSFSSSHIQFAPSHFFDCSRVASPSQSVINSNNSQSYDNRAVDQSNCVPVVGSMSVIYSINELGASVQSTASDSSLGNALSDPEPNAVNENTNHCAQNESSSRLNGTNTICQQNESDHCEPANIVRVTFNTLPTSSSIAWPYLSPAERCASASSANCKKRNISCLVLDEKSHKKRVSISFWLVMFERIPDTR
jgi:hypothetical protein